MKKSSRLSIVIVAVIPLVIGLGIGFGDGHFRIKKEQKVFKSKFNELNHKLVLVQKRMAKEKAEVIFLMQQRSREDLDKLRAESENMGSRLARLKKQVLKSKSSSKVSEVVLARVKKESSEALSKAEKELQAFKLNNTDLNDRVSLLAEEKKGLLTDLMATTQHVDKCESHNARLGIIAEDLLDKYRHKGLGTIFMEKEPITQIQKVELEELVQEYRQKIKEEKIKK